MSDSNIVSLAAYKVLAPRAREPRLPLPQRRHPEIATVLRFEKVRQDYNDNRL